METLTYIMTNHRILLLLMGSSSFPPCLLTDGRVRGEHCEPD
ncbi:hypothetical protein SRABI106_02043 [Rahnella aquatilis]|nr:hypothetical protein SRABI106_02043 [Rahnella aquatilis]